jgi:hypothetical protein
MGELFSDVSGMYLEEMQGCTGVKCGEIEVAEDDK